MPAPAEIYAAIPEDALLLSYYTLHDQLLVFILDRSGFRECARVLLDEPVGRIVHRFREQIAAGDTALKAGSLLFKALVMAAVPHLEDRTRLLLVPHDALHYLPFSTLWYEEDGERVFVRDVLSTSRLPSASSLPWLATADDPDRAWGPAAVFGDPTGDLPGAAREAGRVAERITAAAWIGPDATCDAFLRGTHPAVVHVAGHGHFDASDPLLSGLRMADGLVTVEDLLEQQTAPHLLVLSGCFTGLAGRRPGDELVGLAQAALRNGTRAVVATLWETADDPSALFFDQFYRALVDGATIAQALEWARHAIADRYTDAVDWAPYILFGDGGGKLPERWTISTDDIHTLRSQGMRGFEHIREGRYTEALRTLTATAAAQADFLGPEHPDTIETNAMVAVALAYLARTEEAIDLMERTLRTSTQALGTDHKITEELRENLARAYKEQRSWWRRSLRRLAARSAT
jgi:CHAT domain-containing protein